MLAIVACAVSLRIVGRLERVFMRFWKEEEGGEIVERYVDE